MEYIVIHHTKGQGMPRIETVQTLPDLLAHMAQGNVSSVCGAEPERYNEYETTGKITFTPLYTRQEPAT